VADRDGDRLCRSDGSRVHILFDTITRLTGPRQATFANPRASEGLFLDELTNIS
jgi:hypothetical protein